MNALSEWKRQWGEKMQREEESRTCDIGRESGRIYAVPIGEIIANRAQPRQEFDASALACLADSIRQYGILQPLTVRRLSERYELIAGERRLRAAKLIGLAEVPCMILEVDDRRAAELAIIENVQREDLNMFEQAGAIAALIDIYQITQEEAARRLSSSQSCVANKLRLLRLTASERELILRAGLTERHARAILRISDADRRLAALRVIVSRGMNVAATEAYLDKLLAKSGDTSPGKRRMVLKDIRLFYNTIDRAVFLMKQAGIEAETAKREVGDGVEVLIRIPHVYS